jgi:HK97 family phage major capsid protein
VLGPRIWSMRVVQGVGTKKVGANTRNVLIGDTTGATLYDREQANIAVGWVDDNFARNLRTIRAEERVVLAIEAPAAFRKINTVA